MLTVLGPFLAQVITANAGGRTEARYIAGADNRYEAGAGANVGMSLGWRHFSLSFGYAPSLTVTPLESDSRTAILFHSAFIGGTYVWQHSTLTVTEAVGFGNQNFYVDALAGAAPSAAPVPVDPAAGGTAAPPVTPAPGTPTNTGGTTGQPTQTQGTPAAAQLLSINRVVRYASSRTSASFSNQVSRTLEAGETTSLSIAGALRAQDQTQYPVVVGPGETVYIRYRPDQVDALTSSLSAQYSVISGAATPQAGDSAWVFGASEGWEHRIDRFTSTTVAAGGALTRRPLGGDFVQYSIYPTFSANISNSALMLARGRLAFGAGASSAPVVDLFSGAIDPRLGVGASVGWALKRFSLGVGGSSSFSLHSSAAAGSYRTLSGTAGIAYQFGAALTANAGGRVAWQTYQGVPVVPLTYAMFVGISVGAATRLSH